MGKEHMKKSRFVCGAVAAFCCGAAGAVMIDQVDTFSTPSTDGWGSGGQNPNPPVRIASGGPMGVGDGFLQVTGNGSFGPGGKIVTLNAAQWSGNYLAEGITAIEFDITNTGATDVEIGLRFEGSTGGLISLNTVSVPAGADWTRVSLPMDAASLTGPGNYIATMLNNFRLRIEDPRGPISGQVGLDNITAVPEPATLGLLVIGAALLRRRG